MTDAGGHWVTVTFANGDTRRDWVPDEQPPSPDGRRGTWHIVRSDAAANSRWEWHATHVAVVPPPAAPRSPGRRRAWFAAGAALIAVSVIGLMVAAGDPDGPAELAVSGTEAPTVPGASSPTPRESPRWTPPPTSDRSATPRESGADPSSAPRPTPTTWQEEVLAAGPNDTLRLTPAPADWTAENIVISEDLSGKFLGRVTVRYAGPGAAMGRFAVALVRDGREITVLTGELVEVRSGVYQVMVASTASYVDGPWEARFRVVSTA